MEDTVTSLQITLLSISKPGDEQNLQKMHSAAFNNNIQSLPFSRFKKKAEYIPDYFFL